MQKRQLGDRAETVALSWLEAHNYVLIERNFARRIGEIDLIVRHPDGLTIVFVEVRYRTSFKFGGAVASVNYRKQRKIVRTANSWLQRHVNSLTPARIDIIALCPQHPQTPDSQRWQGHQITWIVNAIEEC